MKMCAIFALLLAMQHPLRASGWDWQRDPQEVGNAINQRCLTIDGEKCVVAKALDQEIVSEGRTTPIRLYTPPVSIHEPLPAVLLIHGGAWVGGSLDTHDNLARYLCNRAASVIVSVGYLNAPKG